MVEMESRTDYQWWKDREDWYETSMIVYMIQYLWVNDADIPDEEFEQVIQWYDDVDMCTGAFGK
jgi:hypothetical protein